MIFKEKEETPKVYPRFREKYEHAFAESRELKLPVYVKTLYQGFQCDDGVSRCCLPAKIGSKPYKPCLGHALTRCFPC